jgi:hypothetical protein
MIPEGARLSAADKTGAGQEGVSLRRCKAEHIRTRDATEAVHHSGGYGGKHGIRIPRNQCARPAPGPVRLRGLAHTARISALPRTGGTANTVSAKNGAAMLQALQGGSAVHLVRMTAPHFAQSTCGNANDLCRRCGYLIPGGIAASAGASGGIVPVLKKAVCLMADRFYCGMCVADAFSRPAPVWGTAPRR